MRRTLWFRSLATLLAVWFPLMVGEPGVLHLCPMHGGSPVASAPQPAAHAHHGAAASTELTSKQGSRQGHDHHHCTCIASCTSTATAVPAPDPPAVVVVEAAYATKSALPNVGSLARPAPEYSRPYTTGPPRV